MNFVEAVGVFAEILGRFGLLALANLGGLAALAWAWYKYDGGKLGFIDWIRGI